jgi:hypothetical protein
MILIIICVILSFLVGFNISKRSGIQPGYFEKAEAPAYGVGGEEKLAPGLGEEYERYFKELYKEE